MKWTFGNYSTSIIVGRKTEPTKSTSYDNEVSILTNFVNSYLIDYIDKLQIVSNTENYTTLKYKEHDLIRLKYSDKSKWITIFIPPKYKEHYINDPLFEKQKNKNQLHWKSSLDTEQDLTKYVDFCLMDINFWQ